MSRRSGTRPAAQRLALRRLWASRGPLLGFLALTALVVACVVTTLGLVEEALRTTLRSDPALAGDGSSITYTTRQGEDPAAQDAMVRGLVSEGAGSAHVVVTRQVLSDDGDVPRVVWRVTVDPDRLTANEVTDLAAGLPPVAAAIKASPAQHRGLVVAGHLPETMTALAERVTIFRAVALAPLLALVAVGAVGLGRLAQQLVAGRRREDVLLYARGLSTGQAVRIAALEAGAVGLAGALLGAVVALGGLRLFSSAAAISSSLLTQAATAVLVAAAGVTLTCAALVRHQGIGLTRGVLGRSRRAVTPVLTIAVAAGLVAVATWRIRSVGSAAGDLDVLAVVSPGLLLVALSVLVLALAGPLLDGLALLAARRPTLAGPLAVRGAARRATLRLPALMAGLAAGLLVLGASYAATGEVRSAVVAHTEAGADVRLVVAGSGPIAPGSVTTAGAAAATARATAATGGSPTAHAAGATMALTTIGTIGSDQVRLTALPRERLPNVLRAGPGEPERLAGLLATPSQPLSGVPLAAASGSGAQVSLLVESVVTEDERPALDSEPPGTSPDGAAPVPPTPVPLPVSAVAWLADDGGAMALVQARTRLPAVPVGAGLGPTGVRTSLVIAPDLPAPVGAWRLVGVDVTAGGDPVDGPEVVRADGRVVGARFVLDRVGTTSGSALRQALAFEPVPPGGAAGERPQAPSPQGSSGQGLTAGATLVPGQEVRFVGAPAGVPEPVRLVVTDTLARTFDLAPGDSSQVRVGGVTVDAVVVGSQAIVPGTTAPLAALLDLDALHGAQLRAGVAPSGAEEVWLSAAGGTPTHRADVAAELATALRASGVAPQDPAQLRVIDDVAGADVSVAFWTSALAALVLALAGLHSTCSAEGAARIGETVALRAQRVSPRVQGLIRAIEIGLVTAVGIVAGLLVGAVVAVLAVPVLVGASSGAVDRALAPEAGLGRLALGLAALVVGGVLVVAEHARRVARTARDLDLREEAG